MEHFNQNIKILHLEPSTVCNAKCPQCPRENTDLYNDNTNRNELTLSKCEELFDSKFIKNLDKMFMCGVFGDPASTREALDIFKYFRKHNPNITLGLNTNGSIRSTSWWIELAEIFNKLTDYVIFSIDGLGDTNHLYRKNVHWHKVMTNAQAFIDAGGSAHWDMLIFKHNEHQVDDARKLANDIGFSEFNTKLTGRFLNHATLEEIDSWPIMDNNDNQVGKLEIPLSTQFKNKSIKNLPLLDTEYFNTTNILCDALHKNPANSRYNKHNEVKVTINAHGWVMPCNFFNHNLHDMRFHDRNALPCSNDLSFTENGTNQIKDLFNQYDAQNNLNINTKSLSEIFENGIWNHILESFNKNIGEGRLFECAMTCGDKLNKVWDQTRK